jgi:hypothetical protein
MTPPNSFHCMYTFFTSLPRKKLQQDNEWYAVLINMKYSYGLFRFDASIIHLKDDIYDYYWLCEALTLTFYRTTRFMNTTNRQNINVGISCLLLSNLPLVFFIPSPLFLFLFPLLLCNFLGKTRKNIVPSIFLPFFYLYYAASVT